jgi:hypothetical protein
MHGLPTLGTKTFTKSEAQFYMQKMLYLGQTLFHNLGDNNNTSTYDIDSYIAPFENILLTYHSTGISKKVRYRPRPLNASVWVDATGSPRKGDPPRRYVVSVVSPAHRAPCRYHGLRLIFVSSHQEVAPRLLPLFPEPLPCCRQHGRSLARLPNRRYCYGDKR